MILVLDIETVSQYPTFEGMPEDWQELWRKKAKYLIEKEKDNKEKDNKDKDNKDKSNKEKDNKDKNNKDKDNEDAATCYKNYAAIQAEFGKVIVIGLGILKTPRDKPATLRVNTLYEEEEKALLLSFKSILDKMPQGYSLCAHNGREFDYPCLCRRFMAHGDPIPDILNVQGKKPWEINDTLEDTMNLWKFGDFKHYTSLELLCACLGLPSSKDHIDGSLVGKLYHEEKDIKKIRDYCRDDVIATAQVYLRLKGLPLLEETSISDASEA